MRSANALLEQVLQFATQDERVRAVILSGSRVNPAVTPDSFQDFDVAFHVRDLSSFLQDHSWIDPFGERMILQMPELMGGRPLNPSKPFFYLIQFLDGLRLDLKLVPVDGRDAYPPESLSKVLLDKDDLFADLPPASERDCLPQKPSAAAFHDCCNEFWWLAPYVAKGLWRRQLGYAKFHLDTLMRGELMKMLDWAFGFRTNFGSNPGKNGKNYGGILPDDWLTRLNQTYAGAELNQNWDALLNMLSLFREVGREVAVASGFFYPEQEDERVTAHVRHVRELPAEAQTIYSQRTEL